jgi:hypothetical protein
VVNPLPRLLYAQERDPIPLVQEAGWVSEPVWMGQENVASTGFRTLDSPARSESLYRLRCPCRLNICVFCIYVNLLEEGKVGCCLTVHVDNIVCLLRTVLLNNTVDTLVFLLMTLTLKHVQTISHLMSKIPPSVKHT